MSKADSKKRALEDNCNMTVTDGETSGNVQVGQSKKKKQMK
jgi:hypothetical protein